MSWLDAYFKSGVKTIAIAGTALPFESTLNFVAGATGVDSPSTGMTNITVSSTGFSSTQSVSGGGSITAKAGALVFVNASGGTCSVSAPAFGAAGALVTWGLSDIDPTTWNATHYASVPNPSSDIEDPTNPGVYTNNPIVFKTPDSVPTWVQDPTATYWKAL